MAQATAERATVPAIDPPDDDRWPRRVAALATVLAALLVLHRLGDKSFWYDEAFSVGIVDRPLGDALWRMANWEVNQSPFFLLFAGWWRLGQSETFLRLLPAIFTILSVPAMYGLGRRLLGPAGGAISALLLACHPLALQWGQQARGYSLVLLLTILAATQVLRAIDEPDAPWPAVAAGGLAALATYGHFFAGLVTASLAAWSLLHRPVPVRALVRAGAVYAVLVAPLAAFLVTRQGDPLNWLRDISTWDSFAGATSDLSGGTGWGVAAYCTAAVSGLWAAGRAWRARPGAPPGLVLAAVWFVAPVVVVLASTLTVKPLLEGRFLIVVLPAFVVLAAAGAAALGRTAGPVLLALVLASSGAGVVTWYDAPPLQDWRSAAQAIDGSVVPEAAVVVEPTRAIWALRYYEDRLGVPPRPVVRPGPLDPPATDDLVQIRIVSNEQLAPLAPEYERWRDEHYRHRADHSVGGVDVHMFERR